MKLRHLFLGRRAVANLDSVVNSRGASLPTKPRAVSAAALLVITCRCEGWTIDTEGWAPKNDASELWCWRRLENPLDCKEIQPVCPEGSQSWIFIGRQAEAETPILWPPNVKKWLLGKGPDAGKDWRQEEKGTIEDEMVEWHHQLDGHELEQALGVGDGQGSLVCCSPWGQRESDTTDSDWTELNTIPHINRIKNKNHVIISINIEKNLTKFNKLHDKNF